MTRSSLPLRGQDVAPHLEASFWSLVRINWPTGCWEWTGMRSAGYGRFKLGAKRHAAHRVSYAVSFGFVPTDKVVMHECHNMLCVAPHHLTLGTDQQNIDAREVRRRAGLNYRPQL